MKMIIVITTEGFSREDGNVYYSRYLIVESPTLDFNEPIFYDNSLSPRAMSEGSDTEERIEKTIAIIKELGYSVEEPDSSVIEIQVE